MIYDLSKVKSFNEEEKLRNVIQVFPVLLTFSFTYEHVLLLNKGSGHTGPWFVLSAKLNSTQLGAHMATCLDFPIIPPQSFCVFFDLFVVVLVLHARMPQ